MRTLVMSKQMEWKHALEQTHAQIAQHQQELTQLQQRAIALDGAIQATAAILAELPQEPPVAVSSAPSDDHVPGSLVILDPDQ